MKYITVLDYATDNIYHISVDTDNDISNEEAENLLKRYKFNIDEISFMISNKSFNASFNIININKYNEINSTPLIKTGDSRILTLKEGDEFILVEDDNPIKAIKLKISKEQNQNCDDCSLKHFNCTYFNCNIMPI